MKSYKTPVRSVLRENSKSGGGYYTGTKSTIPASSISYKNTYI